MLVVRDAGVGMDENTLAKVSEPFFTTKETGTGVGLSLSRQLAKLNNASLAASSRPGRGSVFQMQFRALS